MEAFRTRIAIFFALLFMGFVVAPSVVHLIDKDYDIAVFIDASEEEEKKGNESVKDIEFRLAEMKFKSELELSFKEKSPFDYYADLYSSLFRELISPPPETSIA